MSPLQIPTRTVPYTTKAQVSELTTPTNPSNPPNSGQTKSLVGPFDMGRVFTSQPPIQHALLTMNSEKVTSFS